MPKTKKRGRPAVLIRFTQTDLARLHRVAANRQTPTESYCRRCILAQVDCDVAFPPQGVRG